MTLPWPWGSSPVKLITSTCHHVYMGWTGTDLLEVLAIGSNTMSPLSSHQFMIFAKIHKIYIMTSYFILQNKRISRIFFAWHDLAFESPYPKMVKNVEKTKWAEFLPWVTFSERYLRFPLDYMGDGRDRVGTDVTAIFVLSARNLLNIYPFKVAIINISPEDYISTKSSMTNISASLIFTGGDGRDRFFLWNLPSRHPYI